MLVICSGSSFGKVNSGIGFTESGYNSKSSCQRSACSKTSPLIRSKTFFGVLARLRYSTPSSFTFVGRKKYSVRTSSAFASFNRFEEEGIAVPCSYFLMALADSPTSLANAFMDSPAALRARSKRSANMESSQAIARFIKSLKLCLI